MQFLCFPDESKRFFTVLFVAGSILLSACGARTEEEGASSQAIYNADGDLISGGDGSIPTLGEASPLDELSLRVLSDVNTIETGGTDIATITALVTDGNRNAVADTAVTFSATAGILQNITPTTDTEGEASATLRLPQDFQNQDVVITVSADDFESSVRISATGSTLDVSGPENLILGDTAQLVMRLTAGNGEPIANEAIVVTSTAGNSIVPAELVTGVDGRVEVAIGSGNSSDTVLVTALDGTVSASHTFNVVDDLLVFTNVVEDAELIVGNERIVIANWTYLGEPVVGAVLRFSISAGNIAAPSSVVTDSLGNASIRVTSNSAGPATLRVEAAIGGSPQIDMGLEFIATEPSAINIYASSSRVNVNEISTISALVTDSTGNPVKNSEVSFTGVDLKGGQLSPSSAVTNSAGIASVTFTAGESAAELDEINIEANVTGTDIEDSMTLNVFKRALNLTFGSGNTVNITPLQTQYSLPLIVMVSDGSGTPIEDATVNVSVRPLEYSKGHLELVDSTYRNFTEATDSGDEFNAAFWLGAEDNILCPSEDFDGDRILDTREDSNEDINNNGSLDPQDPASIIGIDGDYATLSGGSLQTDIYGSGYFELLYPASNAGWARVEVTARAEALGEEAIDTYRTWLSMPSSAITAVDLQPANLVSPYGTDVDNEVLRRVLVNNESVEIYRGCTTTN